MWKPIFHPSFSRLNRYVDGEIAARERACVAEHLVRCERCRGRVDDIRRIDEVARSLPDPEAPPHLFEGVLRRLDENQPMILPTAPPGGGGPRAPWVRRVVVSGTVAALLVAVVVGLVDVLGVSRATGTPTSGTLRFEPALPVPGSEVRVVYDAPGSLARHSALLLRGRYRAAGFDADPRIEVATLERGRDGRYRGSFVFPFSVRYGIFVVEDRDATHVDTHAGRFWELLASSDGMRPMFEALEQRWREWDARRGFTTGRRTADSATVLYPDRPEGWWRAFAYDAQITSGPELDSLRARHLRHFERLHEELRSRAAIPDFQLRAMYLWATQLEASEHAAFWRERLIREAPNERRALQERMVEVFGLHWADRPSAALDSLEVMWRAAGATSPPVVQQGLVLAERIGDVALVERWARRAIESGLGTLWAVRRLLAYPELRDTGVAILRERLGRAHVEAARPLDQSREAYARSVRARRGLDLGALGQVLVELGRFEAAADTLLEATKLVWSRAVFENAARAHLQVGDTVTAATVAGLLAVDPGAKTESQESLIREVRAVASPDRWTALLDKARSEMTLRTMEAAQDVALPERIPLVEASTGGQVVLEEVVADVPTVVVFWSRYCGYSLDELPHLTDLRERIEADDVRLLVITSDGVDSDAVPYLERQGVRLPLHFDVEAKANDAFAAWETPTYHVLDADGWLRFPHVPRSEVPRYLEALAAEPEAGGE